MSKHELVKTEVQYEKQFGLKSMTNEEFVSHIMNYSNFGMLSQMALMHVISVGLEACLEQKEQALKEHEEKEKAKKDRKDGKVSISLVHLPSWIGVMEEIQVKYNTKYNH